MSEEWDLGGYGNWNNDIGNMAYLGNENYFNWNNDIGNTAYNSTGGSNWLGNFVGNLFSGQNLPNTLKTLLGIGGMIGSISGGNQKPTYSYSPWQQSAMGGLLGFNASPTQQEIDAMIRSAQSSNAVSGLVPNATSGMFRQTLANKMLENNLKYKTLQAGILGQLGGLAGGGIAQQTSPWYMNLLNYMQQEQQNANIQNLLNRMMGNTMTTSPWYSSLWGNIGV